MNRRSFLSSVTSKSIVAGTLATIPAVGNYSDTVNASLRSQLTQLDKRYRKVKSQLNHMDKTQKRFTKALVVIAGLSLGIDLTLVI